MAEDYDMNLSVDNDDTEGGVGSPTGNPSQSIDIDIGESDIRVHSSGSMDIHIRPKQDLGEAGENGMGMLTENEEISGLDLDLSESSSKEVVEFLKGRDLDLEPSTAESTFEVSKKSTENSSAFHHGSGTSALDMDAQSDSLEQRLQRLEGMLAEHVSEPVSTQPTSTSKTLSPRKVHVNSDLDIHDEADSDKVSISSSSLEERMERLDKMLQMSIHDVSQLEEQSRQHLDIENDDVITSIDREQILGDGDVIKESEDDSTNSSPSKTQISTDYEVLDNNNDEVSKTSDPGSRMNLEDDSLWTKGSESKDSITYLQSWDQVNRMLETAGFSSVPSGDDGLPDPGLLQTQIRELISKYEKRGHVIQELVLSKESGGVKQRGQDASVSSLQAKVDKLEKKLKASQNKCEQLEEEMSSLEVGGNAQTKKLEVQNVGLLQKLKQSEHRVRSKEAALERLQSKLESEVKKQSLQRERDRRLFRDIERRIPKRSSSSDQKILDIVGAFENQREELQKEVDYLKKEVRKLTLSLRDKDNWIQRHSLVGNNSFVGSGSALDALRSELESNHREQQATSAALREKEKVMVEKMAAIERKLKESLKEKQEREEHIENLKLELASRPTMRDWKASQHKVSKLERQLQCAIEALEEEEAKKQGIYFQHEHHAEKKQLLQKVREYYKSSTLPSKPSSEILSEIERMAEDRENEKYQRNRIESTRNQIRKDRMNHKLGLNRLTALPKDTAHEILQSLCRILTLSDPELLVPSVQKMSWIIQAMPRLEKFVKDVASFVAVNGDSETSISGMESGVIQAVLPQIKRWSADARFVALFKKFRKGIISELGKSSNTDFSIMDTVADEQIIKRISNLVKLEISLLGQREAFSTAEEQIHANPDLLVNQIIMHFQQLFNVKQLEGVLPKINEVYVFTNTMKNFMQILRPTLGLPENASTHACLSSLEEQLRDQTAREILIQSKRNSEPGWQ